MNFTEYDLLEHAEAVTGALKKKHAEICEVIKYSPGTVYDWRNRNSGKRSPYMLIVEIYRACISFGVSREDALAPILWVCQKVGLIAFPSPRIIDTSDAVYQSFVNTTKELGDIAHEITKAMDPDSKGGASITPAEASKVTIQIDQLMRQAAALKVIVKKHSRGDQS